MLASRTYLTADSLNGLVAARYCWCCLIAVATFSGCNFIPDLKHKPQYHNPFPQITKVAILPFRNQSQEPSLSGARVSMAYYNELQSIRGFEVIPFGVVENQLAYFETQVLRHPLMVQEDFQRFAKHMGVDAVLQGAITDYDPYYPPRMAMKVNWYAANPGFHPIPVGYGLPWGTKKEKKIPEWIRLESERALASEQLKSQSPVESETGETEHAAKNETPRDAQADSSSGEEPPRMSEVLTSTSQSPEPTPEGIQTTEESSQTSSELPANWPDPQGFIPNSPTAHPPKMRVQSEPIISHMRTYNGNDEDFTQALEEYFYFRDDARFGGWKAHLQRSEDFIRFCCHLHIVETLASRGGQLESRMILRWPINRYER
ncbi:MAG: hypothetical protein ABL921_04105 [Pirellula sp.]